MIALWLTIGLLTGASAVEAQAPPAAGGGSLPANPALEWERKYGPKRQTLDSLVEVASPKAPEPAPEAPQTPPKPAEPLGPVLVAPVPVGSVLWLPEALEAQAQGEALSEAAQAQLWAIAQAREAEEREMAGVLLAMLEVI
jgi:hypothetical protein